MCYYKDLWHFTTNLKILATTFYFKNTFNNYIHPYTLLYISFYYWYHLVLNILSMLIFSSSTLPFKVFCFQNSFNEYIYPYNIYILLLLVSSVFLGTFPSKVFFVYLRLCQAQHCDISFMANIARAFSQKLCTVWHTHASRP